MSLMLAAMPTVVAQAIAPIMGPQPRLENDAAAVELDIDEAAAPRAQAAPATAVCATALPPAFPLAPGVMSELIGLQASVERELPGLFDRRTPDPGRSYFRGRVAA